jgi:hypothetical protein
MMREYYGGNQYRGEGYRVVLFFFSQKDTELGPHEAEPREFTREVARMVARTGHREAPSWRKIPVSLAFLCKKRS